jgi:hypothetical protein
MKRLALVMALVLAAALVAGCAHKASREDNSAPFDLPLKPGADSAAVYVLRPSPVGFAVVMTVYLDTKSNETKVGSTRGGQYVYFEVSPGAHSILSQAENLAKMLLDVQAGKTYFIEQIPRTGIMLAQNSLAPMDDDDAMKALRRLKPGSLVK